MRDARRIAEAAIEQRILSQDRRRGYGKPRLSGRDIRHERE
jgi:hypothetical protein